MNRPDAATEPSMDDILASIRKIIAEEPAAARPLAEFKPKMPETLAATGPAAVAAPAEPKPLDFKVLMEPSRQPAAAATPAPVVSQAPAPSSSSTSASTPAPAAQQAGSLNFALNGMPGTPIGDTKKPIPLDDLADLLEDVPQSPLRPVARAPSAAAPASFAPAPQQNAVPIAPAAATSSAVSPAAAGQPAASPVRVAPPVSGSFADLMRSMPAIKPSPSQAAATPSFGSLGSTVPNGRFNEPASTAAGGIAPSSSPAPSTDGKMDLGAFVPTRGSPSSAPAPSFGAGMLKPAPAAAQAPAAVPAATPVSTFPQEAGEPRAETAIQAAAKPPVAEPLGPSAAAIETADATRQDGNPFRWPGMAGAGQSPSARAPEVQSPGSPSLGAAAGFRAADAGPATSMEAAKTIRPEPSPELGPSPTAVYEVIAAMPTPAKAAEMSAKPAAGATSVISLNTESQPHALAAVEAGVPASISNRPSSPAETPKDTGFGHTELKEIIDKGTKPTATVAFGLRTEAMSANSPSVSSEPASPLTVKPSVSSSGAPADAHAAPRPELDRVAIESTAAAQSALGALAAGLAASSKSFIPSMASIPVVTVIPESAVDTKAGIEETAEPGEAEATAVEAAPAPVEITSAAIGPALPPVVSGLVPAAALVAVFPPAQVPLASSVKEDVMTAEPSKAAPITQLPPAIPAAAAPADDAGPTTSLDDTVAELLRPMLRQWLADNMPRIVEKALRIEVAQSVQRAAAKPPLK